MNLVWKLNKWETQILVRRIEFHALMGKDGLGKAGNRKQFLLNHVDQRDCAGHAVGCA